MLEWIVLSAVKLLKFAIVGVVALTTSCESRPETPEPAVGGGSPRTGTTVLMRELGCADLPSGEAVVRPELAEDVEIVVIVTSAPEGAA